MDFLPDDEQIALSRSASDLLAKRLGDLRDLTAPTWSSRQLARECAALGWFGLAVAEADGGSGASVVEEALVFREIGRTLAPGPFLPTVLGARVAVSAGAGDIAGQIIDGGLVVALAEPGRHDGRVRVFDHHDADLVLTFSDGEATLSTKPAIEEVPSIDELTSLGTADLHASTVVASTSSPAPILLDGWVLVAAMLSGIAEATRDLSVAYLNEREQFGRPIGSFQGLKHQAADMAVHAEAANAITSYAALARAEEHDNARLYCLSARIIAHRAALANARATIQHHGAIGVTFEHTAHFFLKRTHVLGHLLGGTQASLRDLIREPSPLD